MSLIEIKVSLEDLKSRLKYNFSHLNEQDLIFDQTNVDEFIYRLQQKLGNDRNEIIEIIKRIQEY